MDNVFIEQFYERVILPIYSLEKVMWIDHGKVGLDAWAHHFKTADGLRYVLLYEDFPDGSYLKDGLTHEAVKAGDKESLELKFGNEQIDNVTGWFTLYREK